MGSDNTRERLLRATAMEVARHGFKGATLRGVADRANIRAASIFHYFPEGKEQLVRATLAHIMETIATRMTPTLDASSGLSPADLIIQCAALLWNFMAEHPEYAGVLMREAFEPDDRVTEVVRDHAKHVVKLATTYIEACQQAGQLGSFNARRFLLRIASFAMTFHAAPNMRQYILGPRHSVRQEREAFLQQVRAELLGDAGATSE